MDEKSKRKKKMDEKKTTTTLCKVKQASVIFEGNNRMLLSL